MSIPWPGDAATQHWTNTCQVIAVQGMTETAITWHCWSLKTHGKKPLGNIKDTDKLYSKVSNNRLLTVSCWRHMPVCQHQPLQLLQTAQQLQRSSNEVSVMLCRCRCRCCHCLLLRVLASYIMCLELLLFFRNNIPAAAAAMVSTTTAAGTIIVTQCTS
jgi:hypothetical protein